jgi:hypothetical protein
MQLVGNISGFKFIISIFLLYDFPFEVNMKRWSKVRVMTYMMQLNS